MTKHATTTSLDTSLQQSTRQPRRRRSSHLTRWIQEQHSGGASALSASANTVCSFGTQPVQPNPWLAYPELRPRGSEYDNLDSYDIIDETEAFDSTPDPKHEASALPPLLRTSRLLNTSSTLRRIHLPFRPSSPSPTRSPTETLRPCSPTRPSLSATFLPRALRAASSESSTVENNKSHARSSSLSMLFNGSSEPQTEHQGSLSPGPVKKRPSILHFFSSSPSTSSPSSTLVETPPRPSISSVNTLTTSSSDVGGFRPPTSVTSSIFSVPGAPSSPTPWSKSLPSSAARCSSPALLSDLGEQPRSRGRPRVSECSSRPSTAENSTRSTEPTRPYVVYTPSSHATLSSIASSTRGRNYKKLIVSGIGVDEQTRFDGVRRWCESFGEIRCITRVQNGDLHVHFKDPNVADTVCRIRAKVYIAGAGSVFLSWYSGSKR